MIHLPGRFQAVDFLVSWLTRGDATRNRNRAAEADAALAHLVQVLGLAGDPGWPDVVCAVRRVVTHRDAAVRGLELARRGLEAAGTRPGVRVEVVS